MKMSLYSILDNFMTTADVAEYFNVSERRASALIKNRHERFGIGRRWGKFWVVHRDHVDLLTPDKKYRAR